MYIFFLYITFMMKFYILDAQNNVIELDDWQEWARWYENSPNMIVEQTRFKGGILISTVFLSLDHRYYGTEGPPILFETMIFGGPHDQLQNRYCTWQEAFNGHQNAVNFFIDQQFEQVEEPPKMYE